MKKWIKRIGLGILALVFAFVIVMISAFAIFSHRHAQELEAQSTIIQTPRGPIEYAEIGRGTSVLIVHGSPGGYDQSLGTIKASSLAEKGRFIIPSRPGYLRTPLSVGETPEDQAKAFAALLTALHVDKVAVLAGSGGGPSALQFVLQYPERCSALILEEAVTRRQEKQPSPDASIVRDFLIWANVTLAGDAYWQAMNPSDPVIATVGKGLMNSFLPSSRRQVGVENDMQQFSQIGNWPLDKIRCPTLILHGTGDTNVPIADAEYAHAQIPGSEFVKLEGADHLMIVKQRQHIDSLVTAFVAKHAAM